MVRSHKEYTKELELLLELLVDTINTNASYSTMRIEDIRTELDAVRSMDTLRAK